MNRSWSNADQIGASTTRKWTVLVQDIERRKPKKSDGGPLVMLLMKYCNCKDDMFKMDLHFFPFTCSVVFRSMDSLLVALLASCQRRRHKGELLYQITGTKLMFSPFLRNSDGEKTATAFLVDDDAIETASGLFLGIFRKIKEMEAAIVDGNGTETGHVIVTTIGDRNGQPTAKACHQLLG